MNASWRARMADADGSPDRCVVDVLGPANPEPRRGHFRRTAAHACPLALLLLSSVSAAQGLANWNTTAGNWSNANNWDCTINGGPTVHCVPGAGFTVTNVSGDITIDIDASVGKILGNGGSLTLNNQTLTATDPLGIQMATGIFDATDALINGLLIVENLHAATSTFMGNVQAFNASIGNSTLGSLTVSNQLTLAGSSAGANSSLTLAQPSSISSSSISGQFNITGGALAVDAGSTVTSTQTFVTQGSLAIHGGSTFTQTATPVFLGLSSGSSMLDVSGAGSALKLTNTALELGQLGDSTVTVGHLGSIAATGAGGNFLIGLGVAFPTNSTMIVDSGGTASANNITVSGSAIGSSGLLSIFDASSSVTATGQLLLASGGLVNVSNQGSLSVNSLRIQSGSATFDSGATLDVTSATAVLIGSAGAGTVTFQGGATGSASGELVLGTSAASIGNMTIADSFSKWSGSANVSVGEAGAGSLKVSNGGVLVTGSDGSGLSGSIGTQPTGNGIVTVQGGDWTAHGRLQVGAAGTGTLQLLQAGTVESGAAAIGASAGSNGSVSVSGAGSTWRIAGDLAVGSNGGGTMGIFGAGQVINANAVIGDKTGSSGSVTVTGLGSAWQNSGILTVGGNGAAGLTVDTGTVTAGGAAIGSNFAPVQVTVTNHGTLSVLGDVSIGGGASTSVTVQNGGTFDSGVNATIGGSGGDTIVTVTGTDSTWTLHGAGNLTVEDKGSLLVMDGATVTSSSITVDANGVLNAQGGHIVGNVFNHGGTVTPGDATGVMTVTGNFAQTSGILLFEIDGLAPSQFDRLLISGLASITGGSIDIVFGNGFLPAAGESFDLLCASLGLSLANVDFAVSGLPADVGFTETVDASGFQLAFTPAVAAPVDEPHVWALLALGAPLVGCLLRRRARRTAGALR
ncbi:MAG TPA: hypothetical protein VMU47_01120 [Caldimonas sp.]|nr:hypothetical protein [Caldimonas sp.]